MSNCKDKNVDDFFKDFRTEPKNQPKYFFSDALTYYKQLCKMQKQIEELKKRIGGVSKINSSSTIEAVNDDGEYTLNVLPSGIDIEDLENYDVVENRIAEVEGHIDDIDLAINTIESDITNLQTNKQNKLTAGSNITIVNDVISATGGGSSVVIRGSSTIEALLQNNEYILSVIASGLDIEDLLNYDVLESRVSTNEESIEDIDGHISDIDTSIDTIETNITNIQSDITTIEGNVTNLQTSKQDTLSTQQISNINRALVTPLTTPLEKILIGVDESNSEVQYQLGSGLSIDGTTSPYTINAQGTQPVVRNNISVSGTPSALSTYESWDTQELYGYKLDVTINGLTQNSMIENIVMTDSLLSLIGYIVKTGTNTLTLFTETNDALSGTILTLVTSEVSNA